jgi:hypothetical protein
LDDLDWLRWPKGFVCPHCAATTSWILSDGRRSCGGCRQRVSAMAGTIFHRTRTPLTVWFEAAWLMTTQKQGVPWTFSACSDSAATRQPGQCCTGCERRWLFPVEPAWI